MFVTHLIIIIIIICILRCANTQVYYGLKVLIVCLHSLSLSSQENRQHTTQTHVSWPMPFQLTHFSMMILRMHVLYCMIILLGLGHEAIICALCMTKFLSNIILFHDDVIKWKHFPRNWPFVRGIHRSPVNSPHKGQRHGALMFSLICVWINDWVNNGEAGDLRRHRGHYDVIVMYMASVLDNNTMAYNAQV